MGRNGPGDSPEELDDIELTLDNPEHVAVMEEICNIGPQLRLDEPKHKSVIEALEGLGLWPCDIIGPQLLQFINPDEPKHKSLIEALEGLGLWPYNNQRPIITPPLDVSKVKRAKIKVADGTLTLELLYQGDTQQPRYYRISRIDRSTVSASVENLIGADKAVERVSRLERLRDGGNSTARTLLDRLGNIL